MSRYLNSRVSVEERYLQLVSRPITKRKTFSIYRGITKGSVNFPYRAAVNYMGRRHYLGSFKTELEAVMAYNEAALRIIGPHAVLNEIPKHD